MRRLSFALFLLFAVLLTTLPASLARAQWGRDADDVSADFAGGTVRSSFGLGIGEGRLKVQITNDSSRTVNAVVISVYSSAFDFLYGSPDDDDMKHHRVVLKPPLLPHKERVVVVRESDMGRYVKVYLDRVEFPLAIKVNGSLLDTSVAPFQRNGRVLLPLADVARALGAQVEWEGPTQTVTITRQGRTVKLKIGSPLAEVDGKPVQLDVAPITWKDRTMMPVRFVGEQLGAQVEFVAEDNLVEISLAEREEAPGEETQTPPEAEEGGEPAD